MFLMYIWHKRQVFFLFFANIWVNIDGCRLQFWVFVQQRGIKKPVVVPTTAGFLLSYPYWVGQLWGWFANIICRLLRYELSILVVLPTLLRCIFGLLRLLFVVFCDMNFQYLLFYQLYCVVYLGYFGTFLCGCLFFF